MEIIRENAKKSGPFGLTQMPKIVAGNSNMPIGADLLGSGKEEATDHSRERPD